MNQGWMRKVTELITETSFILEDITEQIVVIWYSGGFLFLIVFILMYLLNRKIERKN